MKCVVQRVSRASVVVDGRTVSEIGPGLVVLGAVEEGDGAAEIQWMAEKLVNLRIFSDDEGKMNRSVLDTRGEMLLVSNFTVAGECAKGRRPSFTGAMRPETAQDVFDSFVGEVKRLGVRAGTGVFRAHMDVSLVNDGPVTVIVETPRKS